MPGFELRGGKIGLWKKLVQLNFSARHADCSYLPLREQDASSGGSQDLATGMWTAVSGAIAQSQAVDAVANNLANSDTAAFKKDAPTFKEYLSSAEREPAAEDIARGPIKNKDLYPLDGRDQAFVVVNGTVTNFKQGHLQVTHSPLDLALDGSGFLEVSTPQGIRYTRQGSLKMAMDGRLVTNEGYPVLAASTQPNGQGGSQTQGGVAVGQVDPQTAARYINLRDRGSSFSVSEQGEVFAGDTLIAKLSVAEFADNRKLHKVGGQFFENTDPSNRVTTPPKTIVHQGVIETSNVNPVEEMTNLIKANRLFEHDMKALKTYGDLMQREVNDVGKI